MSGFKNIKMGYAKPGRPSHELMVATMTDKGLASLKDIYDRHQGALKPRELRIKAIVDREVKARQANEEYINECLRERGYTI